MKHFILRATRVIIIMMVCSAMAWAQPGGPGDEGGGTDPDVPISGIELLVAAGALLGIKNILGKKKNTK